MNRLKITRLSLLAFLALFNTQWLHAQSKTATEQPSNYSSSVKIDQIPKGNTSFGAASIGGSIFLYGGHTGKAHSYTQDGLSGKLYCLDTTKNDAKWTEISAGTKLQGFALVSHDNFLYRIGGLTLDPTSKKANNGDSKGPVGKEETTADPKLRSLDSFQRFDPRTNKWEQLVPLPEPRSSHDAVVIGNILYVVGGWSLGNNPEDDEGQWHETAYRIDLSKSKMSWEKIPSPPFIRRAVSLAQMEGKVVVIGGINDEDDLCNDVSIFDTKTNKWSEGPAFPCDEQMAAFGSSSFCVQNTVYCLAMDGMLRKLTPGLKAWADVTQSTRRFFHRAIPLGDDQLVILGGTNMKTGFVLRSEVFDLGKESKSRNSKKDELRSLMSAVPKDYDRLVSSLAKSNADPKRLIQLLRKPMAPVPSPERVKKLKAGWSQWTAKDKSGVSRPYQLYLPQSIAAGKKPSAIIVHIHGAVGKPDFGSGLGSASAVGYAGYLWPKVAEANDFVVVCPLGRQECSWWTANGVDHISAVVRDLRRSLPVPSDSIFCTGFSDGGSGCFFLSMAAPGPFAGFIAMNGNPIVASKASGEQIYLRNMELTPLVAGMTHRDSLYPSKMILPHMTQAIAMGAPITVLAFPKMNHQPSYFKQQSSTFVDFFNKSKRTGNRNRIQWATASLRYAKADWIEILEIEKSSTDPTPLTDDNVMSSEGSVRLGVSIRGSGTGNRIVRIVEGSVGESAGLRVGDQLVKLGSTPISNSRSLRAAAAKLSYNTDFSCEAIRDGKNITLHGTVPKFVSKPIYLRSKPTAYVDCQIIEGDEPQVKLTTRNIKHLRVWLPDSFANASSVKVVKNGAKAMELKVNTISSAALLHRFAETGDSIGLRQAYIDVHQ